MKKKDKLIKKGCGIDIDSRILWVCVFITTFRGQIQWYVEQFDNTVDGITQLKTWLKKKKVTHVAFESTGIYWLMLYSLLEGEFELLVANPRQVKTLKGRKSDRLDCEWIARLLMLGSIHASFIPPKSIRELRGLTRQYRNLIEDNVRIKNRIIKTLREACITIDQHMSTIFCKSGRLIIQALIIGKSVEEVSTLAKGKLKIKIPYLKEALRFPLSEHYRKILKTYWRQLLFIEKELTLLNKIIDEKVIPFEDIIKLITTMNGIQRKTAIGIISEIGTDMSFFPSAKNLASWVKVCPGSNSSAGKRKSGRNSKGNRYLRAYLGEAAWAAVRKKGSYFRDLYLRRAPRLGKKKAIASITHKMLRILYSMLSNNIDYDTAFELSCEGNPRKVHRKFQGVTNEDLVQELLNRGATDIKWSWEEVEPVVQSV